MLVVAQQIRPRHRLSGALFAALTASAAPSLARDDIGFELTDASSTLYNFDNRDTRAGQVSSVANDHFGMFYNRLNLQANRGRVVASLRLDNAWFFASQTPADVASELARQVPETDRTSEFFARKATEAGIELSNRFINWAYPAKYSVTLGDPDLELTLGDSYAQFGRGFVLSLRKQDELASDTTLRGVRLGARSRVGPATTRVTLLGGSLNPLRLDEASGRYLGVAADVTPGFLKATEALMPRSIETAFAPEAYRCLGSATCSYAPDRLLAGQLELGFERLLLGTQVSVVFRQAPLTSDISRSASSITTLSQSLELPNLTRNTSVYAEFAVQKAAFDGSRSPPLGHAVYATASYVTAGASLILEARHTRRLFPLSANVSTLRAREFSTLQYNATPTTEEVWNDTQFGSFNVCATGARLKAELPVAQGKSVFARVGHQRTFSESVSNDRCVAARRNENRVWDVAVGLEARRPGPSARLHAEWGVRFDDAGRELSTLTGPSSAFYRELFLRYQVTEPLGRDLALELSGTHRRRRESVGGPESAWFEGEHTTGIEWGERVGAGFGVEYETRPDTPHHYFNAQLSFRPSQLVSLGLFAGQRRGAQRCVGGVCRVYPAFEGARLDATVRY